MKRSLILLGVVALLFCGTLTAFAQILNPGFETWTSGSPDGWFTNNIQGLGTPVTQSTNKHSGNFAVRGEVVNLMTGSPYSPQIIAGPSAGGFTIAQRPAAINGWYQFSPQSGDRLSISTALFKGGLSGTGVAGGGIVLTNAATTYSQFSVPFTYLTSDVPDLFTFTVIIDGPGNGTPHAGSYFLLDDLAFGTVLAVRDDLTLPSSFALEQNYPNPFNPSTNIRFSVAQAGHVSLKVYSVLGVEVASLVNDQKEIGTFSVNWNAAGLPSGMYMYRLSVTSDKGQVFDQSKKLVLMK